MNDRFEDTIQSGQVPEEQGEVPPSVAARIDEVCDRFEADWQAGRQPRIEEVLAAELVRQRIRRIALLGSIFTVQGSLWGQLAGIDIVKPEPDEIAFIGAAYQRILDGKTDPADADGFRRIARALQARGAETILIAGTDLVVLFDEQTAGFPCLDVARLHIDAIVETLAS